MSSSWINLDALWKIIVFGVLLGAGLPALFAIGLRVLEPGSPATVAAESPDGTAGSAAQANLAARAFAVLCFAVILAAIGWGIYEIVNQA